MHRAEKSSSKICRAREVEKAQELHRKKIDGVKSYLGGFTPIASRSSTVIHLRPARSTMGSFSPMACAQGEPPLGADGSSANSGSPINLEHLKKSINGGKTSGASETLVLDNTSSQETQILDEFQRSLAKMDEFRGVAPIPGLGSIAPAKRYSNKCAPPPGSRKKSLNGSFRARRLKEIKADNAQILERIRKSVSFYRNDDLQRDWQKNVSYLSSVSEFLVSVDSTTFPRSGQKQHDESRSCLGPSPRRTRNFLRSTNRPEPLPSIPVIAHPIKYIPTSPKKLQLNMSPAFRSLRKAMPQQPSLPPISSPHSVLNAGGALDFNSSASNNLLLSPRGQNTCPNGPGIDNHFAETTSTPYRSATAIAATKFIGDLHGRQAECAVSSDAKYQLLKTGRFVGGTYLVLTVFCGDSVTNAYGFDVFAYHRELHCEYKLSITKEMTHELLAKSSSSLLAAETEAAAGTNLSMQEIARSICDHINFALLGTDKGEMVFLTANVARPCDQAMRFDASPGLVAFCLHQTVEIESVEVQSPTSSSSRLSRSKRRAHVFASTCPRQHCPGSMLSSTATRTDVGMGTTGLAICFEVMDTSSPSRYMASSCESFAQDSSLLRVEASINELYNIILFDSWRNQQRIVSMERMVVATIQHLHIISVPTSDGIGTLRNELIVNSHMNTLLHPCSSQAVGPTTLEKKRSSQQLPHSTSQLFVPLIRATILIQCGLIWRNCYLLAEIALDNMEDDTHTATWTRQKNRQRKIQDAECDLIVSVFNSNSGRSTCRRFSPEKVDVLLGRLESKTEVVSGESIRERNTFARHLLAHLELDVDLFGQEVIVFPALEYTSLSGDAGEESEQPFEEAASPEVQAQEFQPWEEGNVSEDDEGADSDTYDEEELDEAPSAGILPYDEEEREEADASYSSYANQDEADLCESIEAPKTHRLIDEDKPEREENTDSKPSTRRQRRQGRKIDGRFCLLQGSSDTLTLSYTVAALGHLESLATVHTV